MSVSLRHVLAWSAPALPVAALGLPLVVFLPPHYSGTLGLPLATVGFIFAAVRIIDIPLDPMLGALMDIGRSRFGQYRPWLLAGGLMTLVGIWMSFMAAPGISAGYALSSLLLLYVGMSVIYLAQTAWGSRLSTDYEGRTRIFGYWTAANSAAMLLVLLMPPIVSGVTGDGSSTLMVHAMGWLVLLLVPTTVLLAVFGVPEGEADATRHRTRIADVVELLADRRMAMLLGGNLLLSILPSLTGALYLFFFTGVRGFSAVAASALLVGYFVAALAAAPLWVKGAHRFGKHRMLAVAGLWMGVVQLLIWATPESEAALTAAAFILAGVPAAAPQFLLRAMLSDLRDAQDLERHQTGQALHDATGLSFAILTAVGKLGAAITFGLTYPLLGLVGFDPRPGAVNSAAAVTGLTQLFILAPLVLGMLSAATVWRWPITAAVHARIRASLDALAGSAPVATEATPAAIAPAVIAEPGLSA